LIKFKLKSLLTFSDIMLVPPMVERPGQVVGVLVLLWFLFIIFNIFLSKQPIFSTTNLIFISFIIATIIVYFFGKKFFKGHS